MLRKYKRYVMHELAQCVLRIPHEQMHMVVHKTPCVVLHLVLLAIFFEKRQEELPV